MDPQSALAAAHGVATEYEDQGHQLVQVPPDAVRKVLAALGIDPADPAPPTDFAGGELPPTVVMTLGQPPDLPPGPVTVDLEDGGTLQTTVAGLADLPLGFHGIRRGNQLPEAVPATLVVAPAQAPQPPRTWGWMLQLYAIRSAASWGLGDFADLAELARWSGAELGAGLILVNPLHAVAPVVPLEPSPYYPTSRRFVNPIYLRVENVPEYAAAPVDVRAEVDALGAPLRARNREDRLDRDAVWTAKMAALSLLWRYARREELADFRRRTPGIDTYALFAAIAERHGSSWLRWPDELRNPQGRAARLAREERRDRVDFAAWLQLLCAEQLSAAQHAATESGMPVGIVHDLAVGVDPGGADAWALQHVLAEGATVGAPPDLYTPPGQNWQLPPWHPRRLAEVGYRPYRELLQSVLGAGGGVRIDHILGLFRLWWIPAGGAASEGSFVAYDDFALLGILALEAQRAGAIVVGEDLGTVQPRVQTALVERGILGSALLWFERYVDPVTHADGPRKRPEDWRELALASISTHDLPTAAGFLAAEHVRIRDELGQLTRPVAQERAQAARDREEILQLLGDCRLLDERPADPVLAMHEFLARTPCRLVLAQPADAVGDLRQPNLPGTTVEYPNWRLPVAGPDGPITLEDLQGSDRVRKIAEVLGRDRSRTTVR